MPPDVPHQTTGFPRDAYTPHGLLANPAAVARSWSEGSGGVLRTTRDPGCVGVGWVYPWALGAEAGAELRITLYVDDPGRQVGFPAFDDFDALPDVHAEHHTAQLLELVWDQLGYRWRASYTLIGDDELGLEVSAERDLGQEPPVARSASGLAQLQTSVSVEAWGWRAEPKEATGAATVDTVTWAPLAVRHPKASEAAAQPAGHIRLGGSLSEHGLYVDAATDRAWPRERRIDGSEGELRDVPRPGRFAAIREYVTLPRSHESGVVLRATLHRDAEGGGDVGARVSAAISGARAKDDAVWRGGARLTGDWPASWRRGWVYDLETTRMCVMPAGGIFTDVWPSWMVQWPRAVVAEGTLDMVRLAYLSPDLAKRAVLSLFRDATAQNVPCVFQAGEPNMVAKDGAVCGTSPAWCVPFHNLERLYLLTLDDAWLAQLYPYLAAYLDWWLAERADRDGWAVYKCTWEAGEDDTPRLDPERRGDNVVSEFVRLVELQATMALSASVLARFAVSLDRVGDATRWRAVADDYAAKTETLWDEQAGRYRDWDARRGRFLGPPSETNRLDRSRKQPVETNYWGIDPLRYSALAFTPVLAGLADADRLDVLAREAALYDCPPWTLWASWSYVILEAATAAGWWELAARVAAGIVGRVYPELDRRTVVGSEPTPGTAREYWPLDLSEWRSCEGYGWGATTASFLARQVFGFLEGGYAHEGRLRFRLAPGLPDALCVAGRRYGLTNVPYRGAQLDLAYEAGEPARDSAPPSPTRLTAVAAGLTAVVAARSASGEPIETRCVVSDESGADVYRSDEASAVHRFAVWRYTPYDVALETSPRPDQ